jgi:hypothetical protein
MPEMVDDSDHVCNNLVESEEVEVIPPPEHGVEVNVSVDSLGEVKGNIDGC